MPNPLKAYAAKEIADMELGRDIVCDELEHGPGRTAQEYAAADFAKRTYRWEHPDGREEPGLFWDDVLLMTDACKKGKIVDESREEIVAVVF